jgi:UDP-N-acetylglucosamine acyltransferase
MTVSIHPTAVVDAGAKLDHDVTVGPYCVVGDGVTIGSGTTLQNHVIVQGPTTIGRHNIVYPFAVLGADPQDLKYKGTPTKLLIGDYNRIREHATIHRGTELGGGATRVGSHCLIMVGTHIAHDCVIEDEVVIANDTLLGGHCRIEAGAAIGGGAGLHHFTCVGTMAFVGGMSRVSKDVPPYCVVEGCPAEPRKINTTALARRRWPDAEIDLLREAFRRLYRAHANGITVREAIAGLRSEHPACRPVQRLCDFVERTDTGVHGRQLERSRDPEASRR